MLCHSMDRHPAITDALGTLSFPRWLQRWALVVGPRQRSTQGTRGRGAPALVIGLTQALGVYTASASTEGGFEQEQFAPSLVCSTHGHRSIPLGVVFQGHPLSSHGLPPTHKRVGFVPTRGGAVRVKGSGPPWPPSRPVALHPTTSVLTAAMSVYALGAGITAAAGTRLALQLILITGFG